MSRGDSRLASICCKSYGAVGLWVEENGYRITGPVREVLIRPPRTNDLNEMVTELQFPVETTRNTLEMV